MGAYFASAVLVINLVAALLVMGRNYQGRSRTTTADMMWHHKIYHPVILSAGFAVFYVAWVSACTLWNALNEPIRVTRAIAALIAIALITIVLVRRMQAGASVTAASAFEQASVRVGDSFVIVIAASVACVAATQVLLGGAPSWLHTSIYATAASVLPSFYWSLRWRSRSVPVKVWRVHEHSDDVQIAMFAWVAIHAILFRDQIKWAAGLLGAHLDAAVLMGHSFVVLLALALVWAVWRYVVPRLLPRSIWRRAEALIEREDAPPDAPHLLPPPRGMLSGVVRIISSNKKGA